MHPTGRRASRTLRIAARAVLPAVLMVAIGVSCGSGDSTEPVSAQQAIRVGAADAAGELGPDWTRPERPYFADATIVERCGDPLAGLDAPDGGLVGHALSPVLSRSPEGDDGSYGNVRTAVLAYTDGASAEAAARHLDERAFERCLIDTTNRYLQAGSDGFDPLPAATADSFDTSGPAASGDGASLITSTFEEEVIGGFDNTHDVALFVTRSGRFVAAAFAASNHQVADPGNPASLARRLGSSALASATAG